MLAGPDLLCHWIPFQRYTSLSLESHVPAQTTWEVAVPLVSILTDQFIDQVRVSEVPNVVQIPCGEGIGRFEWNRAMKS